MSGGAWGAGGALLLLIAGVWVLTQTLWGNLAGRLTGNASSSSSSSSSVSGSAAKAGAAFGSAAAHTLGQAATGAARSAAKTVVGPPNTGPGGISSPQIFPGLSTNIFNRIRSRIP